MLILIDPSNAANYVEELDSMYRLRKRIFHDQLGWNVRIKDGREQDEYDEMDPVYILSIDEMSGAVRGSVRLMPTTGPNLMRDVFGAWFSESVVFESANIWEVTRFCVDPVWLRGPYTARGMNLATAELIVGLSDVASDIGLTQLTALCHRGMVTALNRARCPHEIIAEAETPAGGRVYLGLWDVSHDISRQLRETTGLAEPFAKGNSLLRAA